MRDLVVTKFGDNRPFPTSCNPLADMQLAVDLRAAILVLGGLGETCRPQLLSRSYNIGNDPTELTRNLKPAQWSLMRAVRVLWKSIRNPYGCLGEAPE